jgi:hypothetical protein
MQPEKACIFGPIIIFFTIFALLVAGFIILVVKLIKKGKASAWQGELVDKLYRSRDDSDSGRTEHFYTLVFKTIEGKMIKVGTSREIYDSYVIGDKAEKKSGELGLKKII